MFIWASLKTLLSFFSLSFACPPLLGIRKRKKRRFFRDYHISYGKERGTDLKDETVHISYAMYDKTGAFAKIAGTAMLSMLHNTKSKVCVHLLHDDTLTQENRNKFIKLIRSYGQEICFYNVEKLLPEAFAKIPEGGRFSKATLYRLLLNRFLPEDVEKIIYLDTDTIVTCDILELYSEETGENGIAAVSEKALTNNRMLKKAICNDGYVDEDRYFNAGVLLINLEKLRLFPNLCIDGLNLLQNHPEWDCFDQDILNYYFAKDYRPLPLRYDIFTIVERLDNRYEIKSGIYHYAGMDVDVFQSGDVYNREWFKYFIKTPWFDADMLIKIFDLTPSNDNYRRELLRGIFNATRGKRCVFFSAVESEEAARVLFKMSPFERFVGIGAIENSLDIETLVKEMRNLAPGEIGVLCFGNYAYIRDNLAINNLKENEDFINGTAFLPPANGGDPVYGKEIIQRI